MGWWEDVSPIKLVGVMGCACPSKDEFLRYVIAYLGLSLTDDYGTKMGRDSGQRSESLRLFLKGLWQAREKLPECHYSPRAAAGFCATHRCLWMNTPKFEKFFEGTDAEGRAQKFRSIYSARQPLYQATLRLQYYKPVDDWRKGVTPGPDRIDDSKYREIHGLFPGGFDRLPFSGYVVVAYKQGQRRLWIGTRSEEDLEALDSKENPPETPRARGCKSDHLAPRENPLIRIELFQPCVSTGQTEERDVGQPAPPAGDQLDWVVRESIGPCADRTFEEFRKRLCWPLNPRELLEKEGKDPSLAASHVPELFSYLPHRLRRRPDSYAHRGELEQWPDTELDEVVMELLQPRDGPWRVLVEAPAGYGKTTFLHVLALAVAKQHKTALPPVSMPAWVASRLPITLEGLAALLEPTLPTPTELQDTPSSRIVERLLRSGRAVVFLDGLDQVEDPFSLLANLLRPRKLPVKIVASLREELGSGADCELFDTVLRLGTPDPTEASDTALPLAVRGVLRTDLEAYRPHRRTLSDSSVPSRAQPYSPFWIHTARLLLYQGKLPVSADGVSLVNAYLNELLRLAAEHAGRKSGYSLGELGRFHKRLRRAMAAVALNGLRFCPANRRPTLGEVPDEIVQHSWDTLQASAFEEDSILEYVARHAALVYERNYDHSGPVWVFHHQLLQEYLAAEAAATELERAAASPEQNERGAHILETVIRLVQQVIQPVDPSNTDFRHPEQLSRVVALSFWSFLVDALASRGRALTFEDRCDLVVGISRTLRHMAGDSFRSALLRVRDLLCERDSVLTEGLRGTQPETPEANEGTCLGRVGAEQSVPDPFALLVWPGERDELAKQLESVSIEELRMQLRREEPNADWRAGRFGRRVIAVAGDDGTAWAYVPSGEFLAGGWESATEYPARVEKTGAFLILLGTVRVADYWRFAQGGYDLAEPWWRGVPNGAIADCSDGTSPEPLLIPRRYWEYCENVGWSIALGFWDDDPPWWEEDECMMVSWWEATAYCRWLSLERTGWARADVYRLPTEAEWEKAFRGLYGRRRLPESLQRGCLGGQSPFCLERSPAGDFEWTSSAWRHSGFGPPIRGLSEEDGVAVRGFIVGEAHVRRCAARDWSPPEGTQPINDPLSEGSFRCVRVLDTRPRNRRTKERYSDADYRGQVKLPFPKRARR